MYTYFYMSVIKYRNLEVYKSENLSIIVIFENTFIWMILLQKIMKFLIILNNI